MGKALAIGSRVILGLIFFALGLMYFLPIQMPMPDPNSLAGQWFHVMLKTKYFLPLLKGTETVCGLMLLTGIFMPLALVVLAPIVINIFMFHTFVEPSGFPMAVGIVVLMLVQAKLNWKHFSGLFDTKF
jgi:putative oxidoreductase